MFKQLKKRKKTAALCAAIFFILLSAVSYNFVQPVRDLTRWLLFSKSYKSSVLTQVAKNGELKHAEWDGWGWAGMNTTVYLVFDPNDSLAEPAHSKQSGKFNGLPCEVYRVRQMESQWYTVQFYTEQSWGIPKQDCE